MAKKSCLLLLLHRSGIKQSIMFLCKPHLKNRGQFRIAVAAQSRQRQSLLRLWSVLPIMGDTHFCRLLASKLGSVHCRVFCPSFFQHHSHKMNRDNEPNGFIKIPKEISCRSVQKCCQDIESRKGFEIFTYFMNSTLCRSMVP